jgi:putative Mn2+ efflux pump MntP
MVQLKLFHLKEFLKMDLLSTILLAVGLSMDAVAVSISTCLTVKEIKIRHALRMALFFGVFQAAMPLIGWLAGIGVRILIQHLANRI